MNRISYDYMLYMYYNNNIMVGNENTVPPMEYAMSFAQGPIYKRGMPGPSFTWTLFSNTIQGTLDTLLLPLNQPQLSPQQSQEYLSTTTTTTTSHKNRNIVTIVLERLDESLVVLANEFNWSLADVVVIKQRYYHHSTLHYY